MNGTITDNLTPTRMTDKKAAQEFIESNEILMYLGDLDKKMLAFDIEKLILQRKIDYLENFKLQP